MQIIEILSPYAKFVIPLGTIIIFTLAGYIARKIVDRYVVAWAKKSKFKIDDVIIDAIRVPLILWFTLAGVSVALGMIDISPQMLGYANKGITALIILSGIFVFVKISIGIIQYYVAQVEGFKPVSGMAQRLLKIMIWAVGLMIVLQTVGVEITPLLATFGIGALAVALAIQDTLAIFFAGFYILSEQPIRI